MLVGRLAGVDDLFQSTPPRRGRPDRRSRPAPSKGFNPRPREGGDLAFAEGLLQAEPFQSTPPRRGRHAPSFVSTYSRLFQSTPPRRGRLEHGAPATQHLVVSIHAPAKGATCGALRARRPHRCFNPRPREGGDYSDAPILPSAETFQSTPPRRGRLDGGSSMSTGVEFQSTPPRRGRPEDDVFYVAYSRFQSTPPRRGRHANG